MLKQLLLLLILPLFSQYSIGQNEFMISGKVTVANEYPVRNIRVESKKARTAVLTDSLGRYQLICKNSDRVEIDTPGFKAVSRKVKSKNNVLDINIEIITGQKNIDLVTRAGYIDKEDLTNALSYLSNGNFYKYVDIFDLIKELFPLVIIDKSSSPPRLYLRSGEQTSSINTNTSMMYEVDGITVADISGIVPSDIQSIDIVKGTAASIYGSQGAAGVLLISTINR